MLKTLQSTVGTFKHHKVLLAFLLLLQLLYFIIQAVIIVKYLIIGGEQLQTFFGLLQNANYDAELIKGGMPFLQNVGMFYSKYYALITTVQQLIGYQLLVFALVGVALWTGTKLMFRNASFKEALTLYGQLLVRALLFLIPFFVIISTLLNNSLNLASEITPAFYVVIAVCVLLFYFMLVNLALDGSFAEVLKRTFIVGLKKIHYILVTLLVIAAAIGGSAYLVYLTIDMALWILTLCILLFVVVAVLGRILFVGVVREVSGSTLSTKL